MNLEDHPGDVICKARTAANVSAEDAAAAAGVTPDDIAALEPIRNRFPKVKLHSGARNAPVDQRNRANDFIHLGSLRITNRDTPGHAEDGVTYVIGNWPEDAPSVAVVGDAIFAGSMGGARQQADLVKERDRC